MQLLLLAAAFLFRRDCAGAMWPDEYATRCEVGACPCFRCPVGCVPDMSQCCQVCPPWEGDNGGCKNNLSCGDDVECELPLGGTMGPGPCKREDSMCGGDEKMSIGA